MVEQARVVRLVKTRLTATLFLVLHAKQMERIIPICHEHFFAVPKHEAKDMNRRLSDLPFNQRNYPQLEQHKEHSA